MAKMCFYKHFEIYQLLQSFMIVKHIIATTIIVKFDKRILFYNETPKLSKIQQIIFNISISFGDIWTISIVEELGK